MSRGLIGLALAVLGIWLWRRWRAPAASRSAPTANAMPTRRCAHCGTYVAAASALERGDLAYCCAEHAQRGPAVRR